MHNTGGAMDQDLTILSNKFKTNYQLYPDTCHGKVPELVREVRLRGGLKV